MVRVGKFALMALGLATCGMFVGGCASARIASIQKGLSPGTISKSTQILVGEFDSANAAFSGDGAEDEATRNTQNQRVGEELQNRLVAALTAHGYQAGVYDGSAANDAVVIGGQVETNDRGSWAARVWLGMGSGATMLRTSAVAQRGSDIVMDVKVEATSGGSGGFMGSGDFIPTDTQNAVNALVTYINQNAGGGP